MGHYSHVNSCAWFTMNPYVPSVEKFASFIESAKFLQKHKKVRRQERWKKREEKYSRCRYLLLILQCSSEKQRAEALKTALFMVRRTRSWSGERTSPQSSPWASGSRVFCLIIVFWTKFQAINKEGPPEFSGFGPLPGHVSEDRKRVKCEWRIESNWNPWWGNLLNSGDEVIFPSSWGWNGEVWRASPKTDLDKGFLWREGHLSMAWAF